MNTPTICRWGARLSACTAVIFVANGIAHANPPVANPEIWLRADQGIITDGSGLVERWEDQSGNGNDFEQTDPARRPEPLTEGLVTNGGPAFEIPLSSSGGTTYTGTLAVDFVVEESIEVTDLGMWDYLLDGASGQVTVQLWSRDDGGTSDSGGDDSGGSILEQDTFTTAAPGTLVDAHRWKPLAAPRTLAPGAYSIVSWGWTGDDRYINHIDNTGVPHSGEIRLLNTRRFQNVTAVFPNSVSTNAPGYYTGAGNFRYRRSGETLTSHAAVRFDGTNDGLQALASSNLPDPSTVYVVYEQDRNESGYVIQNTTGSHWYVTDQYVNSGGRIVDAQRDWRRPWMVAMSGNATGTRAYVDGQDWSTNPTLTAGEPGRLALGGGSGLTISDPLPARYTELIAYDRELTAIERWETERYLAERYNLFTPDALPPAISPPGGLGTGNVSVTITTDHPGADIRYTTDGSEPTAASTLYSGAFSATRGSQVRARAFVAGISSGAVANETYLDASAPPAASPALWVRADLGLGTDSDGRVMRWQDLSGNGNHLLQTIAGKRPEVLEEGMHAEGGLAISTVRRPNASTSTYSGTLGADFVVDQAIEVTHLVAHDHRADGISGAITVQLVARDDQGTPSTPQDDTAGATLAEIEFNTATPGTLVPGTAFRQIALASPITLAPGAYSILSWGYTGSDGYSNSADAVGREDLIRFVGHSRFGTTPGTFPGSLDSHPVKYNGAGNFRYRPAAGTESSAPAIAFDGGAWNNGIDPASHSLWAAEGSSLNKPSEVFVVFENTTNESGYVLQSTANTGWWFVRNDGVYNDGWVRNRSFTDRHTHVLGVTSTNTGTTANLNGSDWTDVPTLSSGQPGRLALGGADGRTYDPFSVKIAEVIAYDRVLTETERWQVHQALSDRYQVQTDTLPVAAPQITPPGDFGSGNVSVSLASVTPAAQIRYTLDGTTPDASSALYSAAISVPRGTLVTARAFLTGQPESEIVSEFYGGNSDALPVTGAEMWLRADRAVNTDSDGHVNAWGDLTGNGNDVLQVGADKRPTFSENAIDAAAKPALIVPSTTGSVARDRSLGDYFRVDEAIDITHLGAFDHLADGFAADVTVQLWSRLPGDAAGSMLAEAIFTTASPGDLEGTLRFKTLASAVTLAPGDYAIYAWGYTGGNLYREGAAAIANDDPRYTFLADSRYNNTAGSFPTTRQNNTLYYGGAANFKTAPTTAVNAAPAITFDGVDDGLRGVESMNFGRPSTVLAVVQMERAETGHILQNNATSAWNLAREGFQVGNWIYQGNLPTRCGTLVAMRHGSSSSHAFINGIEVTTDTTQASQSPGRLTLGGGIGSGGDSVPVSIAELIVFPFELDETEMAQMSEYVAGRYGIFEALPDTPLIAPASNFGTGSTSVSLSSITPGAEIRYTTDGSEPTAASALYSTTFSVPRGSRVRARAFLGGSASSISAAFYGHELNDGHGVSGTSLWIRADAGLEVDGDGRVQRWADLSGNAHDFEQPVASERPILATEFGGAERIGAPVAPGNGSAVYNGLLASDIAVDTPVELTHLGNFDAYSDGFLGSVTVSLVERDDNGTPLDYTDDTAGATVATMVFDTASPGTLDGGVRFKPLPAPITLTPGDYTLIGGNYDLDRYVSSGAHDEADGSAGLRYTGVARFHATAILPGSIASTSNPSYSGSANLKFRPVGDSAVATEGVRFDGINDGMLGDAALSVGRPSTIFAVYQQHEAAVTTGRMIQSASGTNWLLGMHSPNSTGNGFHPGGWVSQHAIRDRSPSVSVAVQDTDASFYILNGFDLTQTSTHIGNLGRVAIGGGEGTFFQPANGDLAELIIFDRVLDEGELQRVAQYLTGRHDLPTQPLLPPNITPDGGLYSGATTANAAHPVAGTELRYTTDGTTPDQSSLLWAGPLQISADTELKLRAFHPDFLPSETEAAHFFVDNTAPAIPQRDALQVWLRAGVGAETDVDGVTTWRDLSGSGTDAFQETAAAKPDLDPTGIGGQPALSFDGLAEFMQLPAGFDDYSQGLTAIFVARPDTTVGSWERFVDLGRAAANNNIFFGRDATSDDFIYGLYPQTAVLAVDEFEPVSTKLFSVTHLPDGTVNTSVNSTLDNTTTRNLPTDILRTRNFIGDSNWTQDAFYSGHIAEILIFNRALGDLERETLEQSIRTRYGISTDTTGTPDFAPAPGFFSGSVDVALATATSGAQIYYTLDGSEPDQSSALYSAPIALSASAEIRARAYATGLNPSTVNVGTFLVGVPPAAGDGVEGMYFDNADLTGASLTRIDPAIDFNWSSGSPDPAIGNDTFSARWTGQLMPRFTEDYVFHTISADGSRVWIDLDQNGTFDEPGEILIDDWTIHGATERLSPAVSLVAGQLYDFKVEHFENTGVASIVFGWESFSEPKATVPQSQLFSNAQFTQTVATPVINPAGGSYGSAVDVTISTATDNATLYYTTDGSEPDENSTVYGGSFSVGVDSTVRARGFKASHNPSGIASQTYLIDALPPAISGFAWDGNTLSPSQILTAPGVVSVAASDNEGLDRAEFSYQPSGSSARIPLGTDSNASNGLELPWNIAGVADGDYTLWARVYDLTGTWSESSIDVTVLLAVPTAPVITSPSSGTDYDVPTVLLTATAEPGRNVRVFRDGVQIQAAYSNSAGGFSYIAPMQLGDNTFHMVAVNRAGASPMSNSITLTRVREFPVLNLQFGSAMLSEGATLPGTVSIPSAIATDLTISIANNRNSQVQPVAPFVIPAGMTSAGFMLNARADDAIEPPDDLYVEARAAAYQASGVDLTMVDDDWPLVGLSFELASVSEADGALSGMVSRDVAPPAPLRVYLTNTTPDEIEVPAWVDIQAGQTSAAFSATIVDDQDDDGNQTATVTADARATDGSIVSTSTPFDIEVRDDEGPRLALTLVDPFLEETGISELILTRAGAPISTPLGVDLTATPTGQISLPATVAFPANIDEITIPISAPDIPGITGSRSIGIRASSAGYTDALADINLTDEVLPELQAVAITKPSTVITNEFVTVSYRVENFGAVAADGPWFERVFLSTDPAPGDDDVLLRQIEFEGQLAPGAGFTRTLDVLTPTETGRYWLIVKIDTSNVITELDEENNERVAAGAIEVEPAYTATVETAVTTVSANTPITFTGSATAAGGGPAANSLVNIHIRVGDTVRTISAVTDNNGDYSVDWTPLQNEGGEFGVSATHPGVNEIPEPIDSFEILSLELVGPPAVIDIDEGQSVSVSAQLTNTNTVPLTGIATSLPTLPSGLTISAAPPATSLAPGDSMTIPITVNAAAGFSGSGQFPLTVSTAEGPSGAATLRVSASLLSAEFTINPQPMVCSVLRGGQKTAVFTITNTGGLASGPIDVLLPSDVPWISLATEAPLPSIPAGGSADVSLLLSPPADAPLAQTSGNLAINTASGVGKQVPFRFRTVSDMSADLEVEVIDEFFYFAEGAPRLEGATVAVRDAISSSLVAEGATDATGIASFPGLIEGWYRIYVNADDHTSFVGNFLVDAGEVNQERIFISRNFVTYNWTVEQVEIEDTYKVTIESVFETNVPAPVVTVTPNQLEMGDLVALGQSKTINVFVTNHGYVHAEEGEFFFDEHPFYRITPLVDYLGDIPAKSTLTVPVTITRIGVFDDDGSIITLDENGNQGRRRATARDAAPVPCAMGGRLESKDPCPEPTATNSAPFTGSGVRGNCGNGGGGGGGFGGGGGGGWFYASRASSGGNYGTGNSNSSSFKTPEICCDFNEICFGGGAGISTGDLLNNALDAFNGSLGATSPLKLDSLGGSTSFSGKFCICCKDGVIDTSYEIEAKVAVTGSVSYGLRTPPLSAPSGIDIIGDIEVNGFAGLSTEMGGEITLTVKKPCGGEPEVCYAGKVFAKPFVGATLTGTVTLGIDGQNCQGTIAGKIGVEGELSATFGGCGLDKFELTPTASMNLVGEATAKVTCGTGEVSVSLGGKSPSVNARSTREAGATVSVPVGNLLPSTAEILAKPEVQTILGQTAAGGTCATVKIRLEQDVVMTRTATRATLELSNETQDGPITDIGFDLDIRDIDGNPANDLFNIQVTKLTGLDAIDGSGSIPASSSGAVQWTLIPRDTAALMQPQEYTVGGTISYDLAGTDFNVPVESLPITVHPDAALVLKYYHQRDVFSNDPHTDAIEPSIPYKLAVLVENQGYGSANNLKIISGQPEIIENERGLLIDFKIIGTEVDGQQLTPSLTADFGTLPPFESKIATWLMTSTLHGQFIDYSATFEHVSGLGDPRISLLQSVEIHEMNRMVYAEGSKDDGKPDFLVNDVEDALDYPDTVHYSDGGTDLVTTIESGTVTGTLSPTNLSVQLDVATGSGWWYVRLPDPGGSNYQLDRIVRSDGRVLTTEYNAWVTDRTFVGFGLQPVYENILHFADCDSTGSYTLHYTPAPNPDIQPPTSNVLALASFEKPNFTVNWTGTDDRGPVAAYDVFVATDGGPFELWLEATRETGAIFPGIDGVEYAFYSVAIDSAGNREEQLAPDTITTVSGANQAPVIANIPNANIAEGTTFTWQVGAGDPDGNPADLVYSLSSDIGAVSMNPANGRITWTAGEIDGGRVATVTATVTDIGDPPLSASDTFTITVADINSPPTLPAISAQQVDYETPLTIPLQATDPDVPVQSITYSLPVAPVGMNIDLVSGTISWTPGGKSGKKSHSVVVRATDDGATPAYAERAFSVYVNGPLEPPIANFDIDATEMGVPLDIPVSFLLENDIDPEGGTLRFIGVDSGTPAGATVTSDGNVVSYTPAAGFVGCDVFNYIIESESDLSAVGEIHVYVTDPSIDFAIDAITRTPEGFIRITAFGLLEGTYGVRRTEDLADWLYHGFATADENGDLVFTDIDPTSPPRRLYSLIKTPDPLFRPYLLAVTSDAGTDTILFGNVPAGDHDIEYSDDGQFWDPLGTFTTNENGFLSAQDPAPLAGRIYRVSSP